MSKYPTFETRLVPISDAKKLGIKEESSVTYIYNKHNGGHGIKTCITLKCALKWDSPTHFLQFKTPSGEWTHEFKMGAG